MATPTKTLAQALAAWQTVANAASAVGTEVSVTTKFSALVFIKLARVSSTAFTAGWPNVRIEGACRASANADWVPLYSYQMAVGASISATTLNGAIAAGVTSLVVTSATNIAAGDYLFLGHTTLTANYELVRVKSVSSTTVTLEEATTYAHDNGCAITDQAESVVVPLDLTTVTRIRAVIDNVGGGQSVICEVTMNTCDSIG